MENFKNKILSQKMERVVIKFQRKITTEKESRKQYLQN